MERNKELKKEIEALSDELARLQRLMKKEEIPVIIAVEGWGASGKGILINNFILPLDPRGFCVYTIKDENDEESRYPFLRRFMTKTPKKGEISIFDRSWYRRVLNDHIEERVAPERFTQDIEEINDFEKLFTEDGFLLVKLFLNISKSEQKKRLKELSENKETAWRVTQDDIKHNKQYDKYEKVFHKIRELTDKKDAHWKIVDANDLDEASVNIMKYLAEVFAKKLSEHENKPKRERADMKKTPETAHLSSVDLSADIEKKDYKKELFEYQEKLSRIHNRLYLKKQPVAVVFEGWDAAGKGGAIKRLTQAFDPRGYRVVSTPAPTPDELAHHYLWRFWNNIPKTGHIAIFDRSWYGRLMVEPIEGFCNSEEYERAFNEINNFEKHLTNSGMKVIKFFIHISPDEQLKRFYDRKNNPLKAWKLTDEDFRNREKWDEYVYAIERMIENTSTPYAPWHIIAGDSKKYARIEVQKTVINELK